MPELLLVRHGEVDRDLPVERDAAIELTEVGRREAAAVGARLAPVLAQGTSQVWCSPYVRARQTVTIGLAAAGVELPVRVDERLRDREKGVGEFADRETFERRFPDEIERRRRVGRFYYRIPGGESPADVVLRVRSLLRDLADVPADRVLVVCHDVVVLAFRCVAEGWGEETYLELREGNPVPHASLTVLQPDGAHGWRTTLTGDATHVG